MRQRKANTSDLPIFTERFRSLFEENETQESFGSRVGIVRNTVNQYYNGKRIPDSVILRQICERCHVSADWLLGLSDVKTPDVQTQAISKKIGLSEAAIRNLVHLLDDSQLDFRLLDSFLSNYETELYFTLFLMFQYEAYCIEKHNISSTDAEENSNESIEVPDEIVKHNLIKQWKLQRRIERVEFKKYRSQHYLQEALNALIKSDAFERIYQEEESNNGEP
ncbi:MAG: helix-turn-helix transcriptional regulator [Clostridia bacterium]|nr:helix-turn-helix transcriptional regulator [Clostridia bacterium]